MQQQQQLFNQTGQVAPMPASAVSPVTQPQLQPSPVVQTAPVPTPVTAPAPVAAAASTSSNVVKTLLSVVAEKTGYPEEMLEMGMSLDADFGYRLN